MGKYLNQGDFSNKKALRKDLANKLITTGFILENGERCFLACVIIWFRERFSMVALTTQCVCPFTDSRSMKRRKILA